MPPLRPLAATTATLAALACARPTPTPTLGTGARPAPTRSTRAFLLSERDLLPESLAHDPRTGSFYIGSMHRRKIVRRSADGRVSDWAGPAEGLWSILGIKVDTAAGELWANSCNMGDELPMTPPDSATVGRGALFRLRLADAAVIGRYEPTAGARPVCFNDLALAPSGDVFVTAGPGGLWRLPRGGDSLEHLVADTTLWLNGVAAGPDGALYAASDGRGPLRVDPATGRWRPVRAPAGDTLNGIDGLYVHRGALVWIQNGIKPARVVQAPLSEEGLAVTALRTLDRGHPDYDVPTTGVMVGDTLFYIATAQLGAIRPRGRVMPADSLRENVVLRVTVPR
jgi:sugar lactone lactonase YvrE